MIEVMISKAMVVSRASVRVCGSRKRRVWEPEPQRNKAYYRGITQLLVTWSVRVCGARMRACVWEPEATRRWLRARQVHFPRALSRRLLEARSASICFASSEGSATRVLVRAGGTNSLGAGAGAGAGAARDALRGAARPSMRSTSRCAAALSARAMSRSEVGRCAAARGVAP